VTTIVPCWVREALPFNGPPLQCPPVMEGTLVPGEPYSGDALSPVMDWRYFLVFRLCVLPGALGLVGCLLLALWTRAIPAPRLTRPARREHLSSSPQRMPGASMRGITQPERAECAG
jgi:hypothetical protein